MRDECAYLGFLQCEGPGSPLFEDLLVSKHATPSLHQLYWEEHWCFILEGIFKGERTLHKLDFEVSQEGFANKSSHSRVSRKSLVPGGESFLPELFPEAV